MPPTFSEFLAGATAAESAAPGREALLLGGRGWRRKSGNHWHDLKRLLLALVCEERVGGEPGNDSARGATQGPLDREDEEDERSARAREDDPEGGPVDVVPERHQRQHAEDDPDVENERSPRSG